MDSNITIDEIGFGGMKLVQRTDCFKFGIDAVIAADFASKMCPKARNIADLGTGNGIIPFVLSHKLKDSHITGFDVQRQAIELSLESRRINGLEDRIDFVNSDINDLKTIMPEAGRTMDLVVSNPPYVARGGGMTNNASSKFIARQETTADLDDFVSAAAWLLKDRGHLVMVHRPSRLVDLMCTFRKYKLEPKDIRFVAPSYGQVPNIVLIHCVMGGGAQLNFLKPLDVYDGNGNYTDEINTIYERDA